MRPQPRFSALAVLCSEFASSCQHPPLKVEGTDGRVESGGDAEAARARGDVAAASAPYAFTRAAKASAVTGLGRCKGLEGCDASGRTALHVAAGGGAALTAVLAAAAAEGEQEQEEEQTHEGMSAAVQAVRLLLCVGASVHARDADGATPLHAVRRNARSTCFRRSEEHSNRFGEARGGDSLIARHGHVGVVYVPCGFCVCAMWAGGGGGPYGGSEGAAGGRRRRYRDGQARAHSRAGGR